MGTQANVSGQDAVHMSWLVNVWDVKKPLRSRPANGVALVHGLQEDQGNANMCVHLDVRDGISSEPMSPNTSPIQSLGRNADCYADDQANRH